MGVVTSRMFRACSMSINTATLPTVMQGAIAILADKGWRGEGYNWNRFQSAGDFRCIEEGDYVVSLQRDFQVLELVQHKTGGMQYVYSSNGEFEQKYTLGDYWLDFLREFI